MSLPDYTAPYMTSINTILVQAMRNAMTLHPDPALKPIKVTLDFPVTEIDYPAIVVRVYEREIKDMGVGHVEYIPSKTQINAVRKRRHYQWTGDVEFAIYALSSKDRDLLANTVVQTIGFGDMEDWTQQFYDRVRTDDLVTYPDSEITYLSLDTDKISGYGRTQVPAPWGAEDAVVFQTAYRCRAWGEFYNRPFIDKDFGIVDRVDILPYAPSFGEPKPNGTPDTSQWQPPAT